MSNKCPFCGEPATRSHQTGTSYRCGTHGPNDDGKYATGHVCDIATYNRLLGKKDTEIERLTAMATMMADAFEDWEEPTHDGTREWCSRFGTYLRGNVVALATFTEDEWSQVRELFEAAETVGGD